MSEVSSAYQITEPESPRRHAQVTAIDNSKLLEGTSEASSISLNVNAAVKARERLERFKALKARAVSTSMASWSYNTI